MNFFLLKKTQSKPLSNLKLYFFADLDCGWCSTDNVCYGRTFGANCTANLQTTWCPGICPALHDCHACLIHGSERSTGTNVRVRSFASKFGLNQCQWCVQNARCHHKDNYGTCGSGDDTPSQEMGLFSKHFEQMSKF